MAGLQGSRGDGEAAPRAECAFDGYASIVATDPDEFREQLRDWTWEHTQLKPGKFRAEGAIAQFDGVSVGHASINQTLLHKGYAPRDMVAVLMPGPGSGPVFINGQSLEPGQCVTLAEGANLHDVVTHDRYEDIAVGFNLGACQAQFDSLRDGKIGVGPGTTIAAPSPHWVADMASRIDWLLASVEKHPQALADPRRLACLADHLVAAMVHFDPSPADVDATTRTARATRRAGVRVARDLIHSQLGDALPLSELCRHARLKIRSLEYGFHEVTGLTPIAYIRSLRLNAVRRVLQHAAPQRSVSEVAMDMGFWHLSQFSTDYRRFFGETPSETRRRSLVEGGAVKEPKAAAN